MISNIDTLIISFDIKDYDSCILKYINELEKAKEMSRNMLYDNKTEREYIVLGNMHFELMANGSRGYAYLLHNDLFELRIAKYRSKSKNFYPLVVRFKASILWEKGLNSFWYVADYLERTFGKIIDTKVNRVDLALHIDGLNFSVNDIDNFVGRFRKDSLHREDRKVESLYFGSRKTNKCLCRMYNKTREVLEKRDKFWFFDIWNNNNMDVGNVWNVEFELHRDFLKECKIQTYFDLVENVKGLWIYLTEKWIRYVDINSATRAENCKTQQIWKTIQCGYDNFEMDGYIGRDIQRIRDTSKYVPSTVGYLTSLSAIMNIDNVDDAIEYLRFTMKEYLQKTKDSTFENEVDKKKKFYTDLNGGLL